MYNIKEEGNCLFVNAGQVFYLNDSDEDSMG